VFCWHLPSILYRFDAISAFVIAENGRKTISAARGVLYRKWRYRSIPWPRFGIGWVLNFASISHRSKVIRLLRCACKMPFENSGEGYCPPKKKFYRWDPQNALPCSKRRRLRHKLGKSTGAFRRRLVTRSEKNQTGVKQNVQLHHFGQPNPLRWLLWKLAYSMMLGRQYLVRNLVLIGQGVFSRRTLENRPFPLKASIAYTTLPYANALACDDT
jgi:hypothetical protein